MKLLVLLSFLFSIFSSSAFITVGNDGACEFSTINAAVTQAKLTQDFDLRLASNKTYVENLEFDNVAISMTGGFADCNAAMNNSMTPNSFTQIDGSSVFKPVIVYEDVISTSSPIVLKNLEIFNGLGNIITPSGGITIKDVDVQITMENLWLHDNSSEKGGGIYSIRFDSTGDLNLILMKDVNIDSNTAIDGGGLYCTESEIYIYGDSVIQSNQALGPGGSSHNGDGGGIYATANCKLNFYSGNTNFTLGIVSNTANGDGGGIYASGASVVTLDGYQVLLLGQTIGDNTTPVNVTNNLNNFGDGAGIYVQGLSTQVLAYATIINFNSAAGSYGGGVSVSDSAEFSMTRKDQPCWDNYLCNQVYANKVFSSLAFPSYGGAVSARNSASILIEQTIIKQNQAEFGTALSVDASSLNIESVMLFKNGVNGMVNNLQDKSLINLKNNSIATIALSTLANNQVTESVINNISSSVSLFSSIVQDSVNVLASATPSLEQFDCLATHEQTSFIGTNILTLPITFVNQTSDNYHLQNGSVGVDMCNNSLFQPTTNDIDDQLRPLSLNFYDAGSDETNGLVDLIFTHGFEL